MSTQHFAATLAAAALAFVNAGPAFAQVQNFQPVTEQMLQNPAPGDWLSFSRTMDAQRYSPLDQINTENVEELELAWTRGLPAGSTEAMPIVHNGVMFMVAPGAIVQALDGTTGDLLWQYKHDVPDNVARQARTKTIAIWDDVILYTAPDGYVVGIDAVTGELRWKTFAGEAAQTSGPIAVNGKVITGRACTQTRDSCFIAAHDAETGEELWKWYTVPAPGEPGWESWGEVPEDQIANNRASTWGLPGSYDPETNLVLWGVANAMPNTRADRHGGNPDATSRTTPSDLYSNSTVALNPDTGELVWYYQHLPGDDWDEDYTNERILTTITFDPDPANVKWINTNATRGEQRKVSVMMGEGGGIFVNDRETGEFLWAMPFPYDTDRFLISDIDPDGTVHINWDLVLKEPGEQHLICFWNTTSYWPSSYSPRTKSIYVPYVDNCLNMTRAGEGTRERRFGEQRPEGKKDEFAGIAKVNLETGEILRFGQGPVASAGSTVVTAGDVVFHGDLNRRFSAYNANTGEKLWGTILGGPIAVNTMTYEAGGRQYVAVTTGDTLMSGGMANQSGVSPPRGANAVYVFALPQ